MGKKVDVREGENGKETVVALGDKCAL